MSSDAQPSASQLTVAVIGGSISGCIAANLIARAGHEVHVYERSQNNLVGRGGGIATSRTVIQDMKAEGLLPDDFPTVPQTKLRLAKRTDQHETEGRCPWAPELDMQSVHWSGMFNALRSHIPETHYHLGKELQSVKTDADRHHLQFADASTASADLLVFTDGFRSLGRELIHPEVQLDYRGFAVWRGVVDEALFDVGSALDDHPRISYANMPGSFITYLMPSVTGSVTPGERVINWAAYLPVTADELQTYMTDREGHVRTGTVPAGYFPLEKEQELKALMAEQLPSVFARIVAASNDTQFQPIRITEVPSHHKNRMCLVGDAAVAIQPMTGSGAFKAYENARTLADTLSRYTRLEHDLDVWSQQQTLLDQRLLTTGKSMEAAFIWNTIDLATASAEEVQHWWGQMIQYPDDYSYLKVD